MSTIARGYTLRDGVTNDYNYTTLAALVDSATVTNIVISELATATHSIQVSATVPSSDQGDGSLWYDSTLQLFRTKNGDARWDAPSHGPQMASSNGTLPKGAWVVGTGDGTCDVCATGMWPESFGVLMASVVSGGKTVVQSKGLGVGLAIGPCTIGDVLISAGHAIFTYGDGYARSLHSTGISNATLGLPLGQIFASLASGVTGLCTMMIWR